jgi:hypothetical protein
MPLRPLIQVNVENNLLTENVDKEICNLSIFNGGQMLELTADCEICGCCPLCGCKLHAGKREVSISFEEKLDHSRPSLHCLSNVKLNSFKLVS